MSDEEKRPKTAGSFRAWLGGREVLGEVPPVAFCHAPGRYLGIWRWRSGTLLNMNFEQFISKVLRKADFEFRKRRLPLPHPLPSNMK